MTTAEIIEKLMRALPRLEEEISTWAADEPREDWWSWQGAVEDLYTAAGEAIDHLSRQVEQHPDERTIRLVLAARNVAFDDAPSAEELRELDAASEAFAEVIRWSGEEDAV